MASDGEKEQRRLVSDRLPKWAGCRVTVMGLGRFGGGVAAVRYLSSCGARVTITDLRSAEELSDSLEQLADVEVEGVVLGEHPDSVFAGRDVLVVNPAVRPGQPDMERFRQLGLVTSEVELLLSALPAEVQVVGVTGSNGKSTTASLIAHFLEAAGRTVWLGGNIGRSLLPDVGQIAAGDVVVLELSSFQLWHLQEAGFAADVAVVTNLTANHLNWHGDMAAYVAAKQVLLARQSLRQVAVLPADDEKLNGWRVRGRRMMFGDFDSGEEGVFLEDEMLITRQGAMEDAQRTRWPPHLAGTHQRKNVAAAMAAAVACGAPAEVIDTLSEFRPLEHRQQHVATVNGVRFINDSNATTPESTMAALLALSALPGSAAQPALRADITLIAGGASKGVDFDDLAEAIAACVSHVVLIGETAHALQQQIERAVAAGVGACQVQQAESLEAAFRAAVALVSRGGIVLLSPASASFGMFRDYRDRGEQFAKLVRGWAGDSC
ncbi:MAG: UDP-N-acetylmuramoyl-L-alanine--D-glutamate ligase [Planctomycetaceae bacterium]|nr:UDP-N-acetylmuramoyl-L-alanine--D-glutamate ligase [Planctomycetaceae bacterium]